ncbi:MAG TPA: MBL fold metallo-hydrolase [Bacteroidia bacterium]|jgi:hydroxyacylglutathione hydrolase|nr:MBL fold metallo-hydrolase [Bacteroidia bacterium]
MVTVKSFTFGPFQENTFVLHDASNECVIIDPGCYTSSEQMQLKAYIEEEKLKPVYLLNTHCHVDHVSGNAFVHDTYKLLPVIHKNDLVILEGQKRVSDMYGLNCEISPLPEKFIEDGDLISFGNTKLKVLFTPGHAPGHVVFYNAENKFVINGDVLFNRSIGRTDLPYGDFDTLEQSIKTKMYTLPEETVVYCGHGPATSIGEEKYNNPFVNLN